MKKLIVILALLGFWGSGSVSAQELINGIYEREHVASRKPIPYVHVREADVLWSKTVWRIIDLREKINLPLYYPTTSFEGRHSLISILLEGIRLEHLTAYSAKTNGEFSVKISADQVLTDLGGGIDTVWIDTEEGRKPNLVKGDLRTNEVKQIMVKEVWFFDRNYSRMDVRIIGLCPIREFRKEESEELFKQQLFWVYFPEFRDLLARNEVFNPRNDAVRLTFDDVFIKRYFGSYIYQETNVYNNRSVESYAAGVDAMLEADRIKNDLFHKEHDMWEF